MNVIVGWIVGNTQSGPHSFRKKKPFGWQYSDGLVTQSYHEAEIARLRAEVERLRSAASEVADFLVCLPGMSENDVEIVASRLVEGIDAAMGASA